MPTIDQIKNRNANANLHFFDRSTLRFFRSRISEEVFSGPGGVFFVTSEQFVYMHSSKPRAYTVRQFNPETGGVETAGEFQAHKTMRAAKREAARLANG